MSDIKMPALIPELLVTDFQRSLSFWCKELGFSIVYDRPPEKFAMLRKSEAFVMLSQNEGLARKRWMSAEMVRTFGRGIHFQIQIDDLDEVHDRILVSNKSLHMPMETKCYQTGETKIYQRQFAVADPDGYLVRLAEEVEAIAQ